MSDQEYTPWLPVPDVPAELYLEALHHDVEGLRFLLRGLDPLSRTFRLMFESPIGYRNINESYRLKTWQTLQSEKTRPSLLIVRESKWLEWLVAEAGGILDAASLTHYAIFTAEDCIDIVTEFPPDAGCLNEA